MSRQIFSESEKVCLQELIIKYKLHSTATINAGNPTVKKTAWMQLTKEFNSVETNSKRTEAQLKKCWDNLKTRKKALLSYEKKERMRTGGGPFYPKPGPAKDDPILLDEALSEQTNVELLYVVDSDSLPVDTSQEILHFETASYPESEPGPQSQSSMVDTDPETEREITSQNEPASEGQSAQSYNTVTGEEQPVASRHRNAGRVGSHLSDYEGAAPLTPGRRRNAGRVLSDYEGASSLTRGTRNIRAHVIQHEFSLRQENYKKAQAREDELHKLNIEEKKMLIKAAEEIYKKACLEREAAELKLKILKADNPLKHQ